jgi:hypothetical protein
MHRMMVTFAAMALTLGILFGCLPAPVGDPEKSKVDDKMVGAWRYTDAATGDTTIALLRAWDARTYHLTTINQKAADKTTEKRHYKGWLTKIGEATFFTMESLDNANFAFPDPQKKSFWIVGRVTLKDDVITFRPVAEDSWILKDLATREKLEAAITAQLDNNGLYKREQDFKRIKKEEAAAVEEALKADK